MLLMELFLCCCLLLALLLEDGVAVVVFIVFVLGIVAVVASNIWHLAVCVTACWWHCMNQQAVECLELLAAS